MSIFASIFYEGTIPSNPSQADTQRMYPCNVIIENGLINVDYFSTYNKNVKMGSFSTKLDEIEIAEKKAITTNIMGVTINFPTVVLKNTTSTFTLANFCDFPGKKLMGKKAQTADLAEITTAILGAKNISQIDSDSKTETRQVNDEVHTSFDIKTKFHINKKAIIAFIVAIVLACIFLIIVISSALGNNKTSDIYDDNGNGRYDSEDVFGDNADGWLEYAESFD